MVLIEVRNSDRVVGRCDAKCYEASGPNCNCICGGANHGGGIDQAMSNTRQMAERWIEEYSQRMGLVEYESKVNEQVYQRSLFDLIPT